MHAIALIWLVFAQAAATAPATAPTAAPSQPSFPTTWTGRWVGPATTTPAKNAPQAFEMELAIAATDDPKRFTWEIAYIADGKRQVRPYELLVVDAAAGKFVVDEKSSIMIDSQFIDGALYCQFHVQNSIVTGSYRLQDDTIVVELIVADPTKSKESGGENNLPKVQSDPITSVQRAILRRKS